MNILDNYSQIKKLDKSNVLGSVQELGLQLEQTASELKDVKVPADIRMLIRLLLMVWAVPG